MKEKERERKNTKKRKGHGDNQEKPEGELLAQQTLPLHYLRLHISFTSDPGNQVTQFTQNARPSGPVWLPAARSSPPPPLPPLETS